MKKVMIQLMLLPLLSCGQSPKEATASTSTESNKQFIETLVTEPVFEFKGKAKKIILPISLFETTMNSPFILENQTPKYDEMKNILNGETYDKLKGKTIIYTGIEKDNYLFTIDDKKYKIIVTNKEFMGNLEFYNLFDAEYIEKIKKGLVGKTLYAQTAEWIYKSKEGNEIENDKSCQQCPITITRIEKEQSNDYAVYFKHENDNQEYKFDVVLDKDRSFGIPIDLMEEFTKYLSFESPNKPKAMSEKTWKNIQNLKIEKGMTKQEIEQMLGKPDEVITGNVGDGNQEAWFYSNINRKFYKILFTGNKVEKFIIEQFK